MNRNVVLDLLAGNAADEALALMVSLPLRASAAEERQELKAVVDFIDRFEGRARVVAEMPRTGNVIVEAAPEAWRQLLTDAHSPLTAEDTRFFANESIALP